MKPATPLRTPLLSGVLAVLLTTAATGVRGLAPSHGTFTPPDVRSAGDIPLPFQSLALGMVSFLVTLDASGGIQNVQVMRDVPALTGVAQTAVRSWHFVPATKKGVPVPSNISVSVVFNPYNPGGASFQTLTLAPPMVAPSPVPDGPAFVPPQVSSAAFAQYPTASVGFGTVVLDLKIGAGGQLTNVRVVRKIASLTTPCINAVHGWTFDPATLDGKPVAAGLVVAFVFGVNASQP